MLKIEPPENTITKISFSTCLGFTTFQLINASKSYELDLEKSVPLTTKKQNGKDVAYAKDLQGDYFIFVESLQFTPTSPDE